MTHLQVHLKLSAEEKQDMVKTNLNFQRSPIHQFLHMPVSYVVSFWLCWK